MRKKFVFRCVQVLQLRVQLYPHFRCAESALHPDMHGGQNDGDGQTQTSSQGDHWQQLLVRPLPVSTGFFISPVNEIKKHIHKPDCGRTWPICKHCRTQRTSTSEQHESLMRCHKREQPDPAMSWMIATTPHDNIAVKTPPNRRCAVLMIPQGFSITSTSCTSSSIGGTATRITTRLTHVVITFSTTKKRNTAHQITKNTSHTWHEVRSTNLAHNGWFSRQRTSEVSLKTGTCAVQNRRFCQNQCASARTGTLQHRWLCGCKHSL